MLNDADTIGFLATAAPEKAKHFYCKLLGFSAIDDSPFALVLQAKNTTIRIQKTQEVSPPPYTALGWEVNSIADTVRSLSASGVAFERFEGLEQNELGVWSAPGGASVAWFKDPDGHLLSITEPA